MTKHFLVFASLISAILSDIMAQSQWQREFSAVVNGDTLSGAYAGGLRYARVKLVDIDADGDFDALITNYWYNEGTTKIIFYRNDGTPEQPRWTFVTDHFDELAIAGRVLSVNFVDIDSDGDYDLLTGAYTAPNDSSDFFYYRNDGTATSAHFSFITDDFGSLGLQFVVPTFIDIDGDNDLDMFAAVDQQFLYYYRNDGTPFSPQWTLVSDNYDSIKVGYWNCPNFCDIDADGDYDLFSYFRGYWAADTVAFYRNIGNSKTPQWILEPNNFSSLNGYEDCIPEFADIDNDKDYDLFVNTYHYNSTISFFENHGNPSNPQLAFSTNQFFSMPIRGTYPTFVDIDNDRDYDLFVGGDGWNIGLCFYRNDGDAKNPLWTLITGEYDSIGATPDSKDPQFVDIDGDSDFDLFIAGSYYIKYYRNDGNAFHPIWTLITDDFLNGSCLECIPAFVDIDDDGDYDLFIGDFGGWIYFYENRGDAQNYNFIWDSSFNLGDFGNFANPAFVDLDNDRDYDLVVNAVSREPWMQYDIGHVYCFRNDGTQQQPFFLFDPDQTNYFHNMVRGFQDNPTFVDIDGDGDSDLFKNFNNGLIFYRNMLISSATDDKVMPMDFYKGFSLAQNFPNPFNANTLIRYSIAESEHRIQLRIYNLLGEEVVTLVDQVQVSGEYSLIWNGNDKFGKEASTGVYYYELKAGAFKQAKKLIIMR